MDSSMYKNEITDYLSLLSLSAVQFAIIRVGDMKDEVYERYLKKLKLFHSMPLTNLTLPGELRRGESVFEFINWSNGVFHLRFTEMKEIIATPFVKIQANLKIQAVIGLMFCPSFNDVKRAHSSLQETAKNLGCSTFYLFAFEPLDHHFESTELQGISEIILFPNERDVDGGRSIVSFHMENMIGNMCVKLIQHFESCVRVTQNRGLDGFGHPISVPALESSGSWSDKDRRKALEGRMFKLFGDYSMMAGTPKDASGHYSNAIKRSSKVEDHLWHAAALECLASALIHVKCFEEAEDKDTVFSFSESTLPHVHESILHLKDSIQRYRQNNLQQREIMANMRLARYMSSLKKKNFSEAIMCVEVSRSLTESLYHSKLLSVDESICILIQLGFICDIIGAKHKFAFYIYKIASLFQEKKDIVSSYDFSQLAGESYDIDSESFYADTEEFSNKSNANLVSENSNKWNSIRVTLLSHLLSCSISLGNYELTTRHAVRLLLDSINIDIGDEEKIKLQKDVFIKLNAATKSLPPNIKVNFLGLPKVECVSFLNREKSLIPIPTQVKRKVEVASESTNKYFAFHYNPFEVKAVKKSTTLWVEGEISSISVELENPLLIEILAQSVSITSEGVPVEIFPVSLSLPPKSARKCAIGIKPCKAGRLQIKGILIRTFNMLADHGISSFKQQVDDVIQIEVVPRMPLLSFRENIPHSTFLTLLDGEAHPLRLMVDACSSSCDVNFLKISVKISHSIDGSAIPFNQKNDSEKKTSTTTCIFLKDDNENVKTQLNVSPLFISPEMEEDGNETFTTPHFDVIRWNKEEAKALLSILPLKNSSSFQLNLQVHAHRSCDVASIIIEYGETSSSYTRRLVLPVTMYVLPSLSIGPIHVRAFAASIPKQLRSVKNPIAGNKEIGKLAHDNSNNRTIDTDCETCMLVLEIKNETTHMFQLKCSVVNPIQTENNSLFLSKKNTKKEENISTLPDSYELLNTSFTGFSNEEKLYSEDNEYGVVEGGPWMAETFTFILETAAVQRVLLPVRRININENISDERLLPDVLSRNLFLKRIKIVWRSVLGSVGRLLIIDDQPTSKQKLLHPSIYHLMLPPPVKMSLSVTSNGRKSVPSESFETSFSPKRSRALSVFFSEGIEGSELELIKVVDSERNGSVKCPPLVYETLVAKILNKSNKNMNCLVSIHPYQEACNGDIITDLRGKVCISGLIENSIENFPPNEVYEMQLQVCFLTTGIYSFAMRCIDRENSKEFWNVGENIVCLER